MAKLLIKQGATSVKATVFIQDSSSTTGVGLTGLVFNTGSLTAYYYREGDASSTAITLATMTLGTWATGGFIVVDGTNMKGLYQLGLPNACFANLGSVVVYLTGAANMAPVVLEFQVVAFDPTDGVRAGLTALPSAAVGSGANSFNFDSAGFIQSDPQKWLGGAIPAVNVTGVPLVDLKYTLGTLSPAAAGYIGIDWGQVTNKTATVGLTNTTIAAVTVGTNNDKTGYSLVSTGLDLVLVAGQTLPTAIRHIGAMTAGKLSGAGSGTETYLAFDGTTAVTMTLDSSNNRTAVVYA